MTICFLFDVYLEVIISICHTFASSNKQNDNIYIY